MQKNTHAHPPTRARAHTYAHPPPTHTHSRLVGNVLKPELVRDVTLDEVEALGDVVLLCESARAVDARAVRVHKQSLVSPAHSQVRGKACGGVCCGLRKMALDEETRRVKKRCNLSGHVSRHGLHHQQPPVRAAVHPSGPQVLREVLAVTAQHRVHSWQVLGPAPPWSCSLYPSHQSDLHRVVLL